MSPTSEREAAPGPACGLGRRLLVMVYDLVIMVAIWLLATALALALGSGAVTAGKDPLFTFYLLLTWYAYLAFFWRRGGMTVGMRAWRVRILRDDGEAPGWGQCTIRFLASLLSAACLGLGFAWSVFERDRRCWHDIASGTRLVRV
jgi:uncharacterized RDD family membrane protein YckC